MTVFFKTLRNHWKKTTAGICLMTWGGHWLYGKHWISAVSDQADVLFLLGHPFTLASDFAVSGLGPGWFSSRSDNLLRRAACQEAQVFGSQLIPPNAQVKKATVFLNPAACKGKARTLFEKNAAPILHLSGMDVTIVKTDYEGQAKKLLELLENTDVIIVAGGDGTLQEVITGVLRRADELPLVSTQIFLPNLKATFSKIPIGFIPLGQTSSLSQTLFAESGNKVQHITDATLAIVKGETVPLDVLQIKGEKEQPVFALTGLRWGSFRDAGVSVSKYWYLGPLKTKVAHFFSTLKEWPQTHQASLTYTGPAERPPSGAEETPPRPSLYRRILRRLASYWVQPQDAPQEMSPEVWKEVQLSTLELSIMTRNSQLDLASKEDFMNICMEPNTVSKGDFITIGSKKVRDPKVRADGTECLQASRCTLLLPEGTGGSFSIDSEEYEAMPVQVKLLPRKLQFFCDPRKREQLLQSMAQ
ncbi:acylglycerol kinase, mitochondrial isoform X3 [Tursiops truncatus]|uniref:Acylglycerol kinase, mitochondrial n=1 Tax=Tursiops truncatus TaxID=9739 RepID=A0A6J3RY96_TURTR|nr:acylglycerol kinase, mitochondrial isoform X1 [Tursiops truncatus]XP_033719258.1 acylglycerol kinase, mitochondrial isoform X1 [Tursiops truncatus]XP_033719259.1 acylglycerol kinase, mitochondrial isoform X1 [Tursiops truncatus]